MKFLYPICALALTVCLCKLVLDADRAMSTLNRDASTLETALMHANGTFNAINQAVSDPANGLQANLVDLHRTLLVAGGAITNIEKGTRAWQSKQNQLADQAITAEGNLNVVLLSLNNLAAQLSSSLKDQNQSALSLEAGMSESIGSLDSLSSSLKTQMAPIARNLDSSSANIASTTASMDASAKDVQAFIHRETTPVRGTWHVIRGFLESFAGPAASIATAIK